MWNYRVISFLLICILNQLTGISICTMHLHNQNIRRNLLFTAKLWDWVEFVQKKKIVKNICEIKSWFSQGGYPLKLIETETSKVKFSVQRVFHRTKVQKGVPLIVTTPYLNPLERLFMIIYIYHIWMKN